MLEQGKSKIVSVSVQNLGRKCVPFLENDNRITSCHGELNIITSVLNDKSIEPDDDIVFPILGKTGIFWESIRKHLDDDYTDIVYVWKYYYEKSGWLLQVRRKKRTLFWFKVFKDFFSVTFWFGDKAVGIVQDSDLPEDIKHELRIAKKHKIGKSISIHVRHSDDVEHVKKLVAIKIRNSMKEEL